MPCFRPLKPLQQLLVQLCGGGVFVYLFAGVGFHVGRARRKAIDHVAYHAKNKQGPVVTVVSCLLPACVRGDDLVLNAA